MQVECIDQQTFRLTNQGEVPGTLLYHGLFSYKAEIVVTDIGFYDIRPRGFFGTSILVTHEGVEVAELRMNLKGHIVINYPAGQEFIFKNTGIFHNKFIIENKEAQKLIQYEPVLNPEKLNYNFTITHALKSEDPLFILLGVYASNYYMAAMAGLV